MKTKLVFFAVVMLTLIGTGWGIQISRQFAVGAGGELKLQVRHADLKIRVQPGDQVYLRAEGLTESDLEISHSGSLIQVLQRKGGHSGWRDASIELTVPARFNLDLDTGSGDVRVDGNLEGTLKVNTHGGDVSFDDILGEADIRSSGGDIEGGSIEGNSTVRTLGGDIELGSVGGALELSTHGGDIEVDRVANSLKARTMGGDVRVGDVDAEAELSTMGGDIVVGRVSAWASLDTKGGDIELAAATGEVSAKTAGGDIRLEDVAGSIAADTAGGDIEAWLAPQGSKASRLASKGGDITLYLAPGAAVTVQTRIQLRRSWRSRPEEYRVISDFPAAAYEKDPNGNEIRGSYEVNGGGPLVELETVNGDIRILKTSGR